MKAVWLAPALLALIALAPRAAAQDTTVVRPDTVVADTAAATDTVAIAPIAVIPDSAPPGQIGPMGALWRSLLVPGWGQATLGRRTAAGIFVVVEGATLAMTVKTMREVAYLRRIGSARQDDKEQEREDWLVLLAFNHLLSGLEAYVSAQLWDFPGDLRIRHVGDGAAAELRLPLQIR